MGRISTFSSLSLEPLFPHVPWPHKSFTHNQQFAYQSSLHHQSLSENLLASASCFLDCQCVCEDPTKAPPFLSG